MKLINIGFGNMVSAGRLIAVVSPESARSRGLFPTHGIRAVIDATYGRTRAVIITDWGYIILSAIQPKQWPEGFPPNELRHRRPLKMRDNGCGKLYIISAVRNRENTVIKNHGNKKDLVFSVSRDTRPPRIGKPMVYLIYS